MSKWILSSVSLLNRNTFRGFNANLTVAEAVFTEFSAAMMERIVRFWEQGCVEITLTSLPMTSSRFSAQQRGPSSFRMKPSGRMPT